MRKRSQGRPPARRRLRLLFALGLAVAVATTIVGFQVMQATRTYAAPDVKAPKPGGVAGFVFADRDGDGKHDPDEPALDDWKVSAYSTGPLALTSVRSDATGVFRFSPIKYVTPGHDSVQLHVTPVMEGPAELPDGATASQLEQSFTAKLGSTIAIPVASFRLCPEVADCPGVKLPDLAPILTPTGHNEDQYPAPTTTFVDTTEKPGRALLRLASSNANLGGLLHLVAEPVKPLANGRAVQQRVYGDGAVYIREAGTFEYHPTHHHFHFGDFEKYELLAADRKTVLRSGEKVSFCLTDIVPATGDGKAPKRAGGELFLNLPPLECNAKEQGINSGWTDYYGPQLPDQWIDVTDLPSGKYYVRITVNPEHRLLESDYTNNVAEFPVDYQAPQ
jgi:hypothetical protein